MPLMIDVEDLAADLERAEQALEKWIAADRLLSSAHEPTGAFRAEAERARAVVSGEYTLTTDLIMRKLFERLRDARQVEPN